MPIFQVMQFKRYIIPLIGLALCVSGLYYYFLYEPSIKTPVLLLHDGLQVKIAAKADSMLVNSVTHKFDPRDHSTAEQKHVLLPQPEAPIAIPRNVADNDVMSAIVNDDDIIDHIVHDVAAGRRNVGELNIMPKVIDQHAQSKPTTQQKATDVKASPALDKKTYLASHDSQKLLAQIAVASSEPLAMAECNDLLRSHDKITKKYSCIVKSVTNKANTYYIAALSGFSNSAELDNLCKTLHKHKRYCAPYTHAR